jgi:hypothetical protein
MLIKRKTEVPDLLTVLYVPTSVADPQIFRSDPGSVHPKYGFGFESYLNIFADFAFFYNKETFFDLSTFLSGLMHV